MICCKNIVTVISLKFWLSHLKKWEREREREDNNRVAPSCIKIRGVPFQFSLVCYCYFRIERKEGNRGNKNNKILQKPFQISLSSHTLSLSLRHTNTTQPSCCFFQFSLSLSLSLCGAMDELASNSSSSSGNSNGNNNNNVNTNNNAFLETSKAERAMWLMKCPPLVSRALQSPPSSSPPDSSSSEPPRPVAKVVLSIDPLRSNDDNSSTQVFTSFFLYLCVSLLHSLVF